MSIVHPGPQLVSADPDHRTCRLQQAHTASHSGVATWGMDRHQHTSGKQSNVLHRCGPSAHM